jgi:hypothetical protein
VAVRVALQCSEADAHLILSESNTAARLLSRPGEAIYNDANGLLEGNHPFQIAWLSDEERERLLRQLATLARERGFAVKPPVVFEGNVPSDPASNPGLTNRLRLALEGTTSQQVTSVEYQLPLGDAVEIGPPVSIAFGPQGGRNVLLVGNDAEAASGVLATGLLSLSAARVLDSRLAATPTAFLLDGSSPDSIDAAGWSTVCSLLPGRVQRRGPRDAAATLQEITVERQRREADREGQHPPLFVIVYHLSRFRDLRKSEDDYGFGGFGNTGESKPASPGQQFADLIVHGPDVGIHVIVWCDTASNLERWFARGTLREFEQRIALQMNAGDSSNFIDSPAASRLGVNRALLYREPTGTLEKFRPYGRPSQSWLESLRPGAREPDSAPAEAQRAPETRSSGPSSTPPAADDLELATDLDSFTVL